MGTVSRETTGGGAPAPPAAAVEYFGDRLNRVQRYADLLAGPGIERGLLGPREVPRLWERHLLNCAVVHDALPEDSTVADVGSGAGLPGIVLALVRPDVTITLVEPLLRRSAFLNEVVALLDLPNARIVRSRAEDLHSDLTVDVVTARAVAPTERLAQWALPLLRSGGVLVALKGSSVHEELAEAAGVLRTLGAANWGVNEYGADVVDPPTLAAVIEAGDPALVGGRRTRSTRSRRRRS